MSSDKNLKARVLQCTSDNARMSTALVEIAFKCRIYILCLTSTSAQQTRYIGHTEGVLRRFLGKQKVRGAASVEFGY